VGHAAEDDFEAERLPFYSEWDRHLLRPPLCDVCGGLTRVIWIPVLPVGDRVLWVPESFACPCEAEHP
jgi:hypothetical protein